MHCRIEWWQTKVVNLIEIIWYSVLLNPHLQSWYSFANINVGIIARTRFKTSRKLNNNPLSVSETESLKATSPCLKLLVTGLPEAPIVVKYSLLWRGEYSKCRTCRVQIVIAAAYHAMKKKAPEASINFGILKSHPRSRKLIARGTPVETKLTYQLSYSNYHITILCYSIL